ncbi:TetR/AcrR family transcriptional regulator [Streptomyces sp. 7R007]
MCVAGLGELLDRVGEDAFDDRTDVLVLDAARLLWRRGHSGTSTRALTAALGLSTSSLYAAFGSKAGLFEESVRTYAERYRDIYRRAVAETCTGSRALRASSSSRARSATRTPGAMSRAPSAPGRRWRS